MEVERADRSSAARAAYIPAICNAVHPLPAYVNSALDELHEEVSEKSC